MIKDIISIFVSGGFSNYLGQLSLPSIFMLLLVIQLHVDVFVNEETVTVTVAELASV